MTIASAPRLAAAAALALVLAARPVAAQQTTPNIGEPADVIAIEGSGLAGTTQVDFLAIVGGSG